MLLAQILFFSDQADTMIKSTKPVIAVGAIRTGCGKSQTSRRVIEILLEKGLKVVAIRHPMPYGDSEMNKKSSVIARCKRIFEKT